MTPLSPSQHLLELCLALGLFERCQVIGWHSQQLLRLATAFNIILSVPPQACMTSGISVEPFRMLLDLAQLHQLAGNGESCCPDCTKTSALPHLTSALCGYQGLMTGLGGTGERTFASPESQHLTPVLQRVQNAWIQPAWVASKARPCRDRVGCIIIKDHRG